MYVYINIYRDDSLLVVGAHAWGHGGFHGSVNSCFGPLKFERRRPASWQTWLESFIGWRGGRSVGRWGEVIMFIHASTLWLLYGLPNKPEASEGVPFLPPLHSHSPLPHPIPLASAAASCVHPPSFVYSSMVVSRAGLSRKINVSGLFTYSDFRFHHLRRRRRTTRRRRRRRSREEEGRRKRNMRKRKRWRRRMEAIDRENERSKQVNKKTMMLLFISSSLSFSRIIYLNADPER